jgi:hypothetical protein
MYARIQTLDFGGAAVGREALVDTIAGQPGCTGRYHLQPVDSTGQRLITLWETEDEARNSADRAPRLDVPLITDLIYEVRDDDAGVSFDTPPTAAVIGWFTGPMSEQTAEIGRRARRERIAPAMLMVPGVVRLISLFQPDTQEPCTLALLTSADVVPAVRTALDAIELPPEEEWVRSPDHLEFFAVLATGT